MSAGNPRLASERATLVGRQDQFALFDLELYEAEAWCLVAFRAGRTEEQHVVLAASFFPVDFANQRWQLLEIGRVGVHEDGAAVVPPVYPGFPVFLNLSFPAHEERQFASELFPCDIVSLENIEQFRRGQRYRLVQ